MNDLRVFSASRPLAEYRVRDSLKSLCCEPLTFMWNNYLLEARKEWSDIADTKDGDVAQMMFLCGFRVTQGFMFLKRDTVLYRCPFCNNELIEALGYWEIEGRWMLKKMDSLAKGKPVFDILPAALKKYLIETKKRCKGVWPPKE